MLRNSEHSLGLDALVGFCPVNFGMAEITEDCDSHIGASAYHVTRFTRVAETHVTIDSVDHAISLSLIARSRRASALPPARVLVLYVSLSGYYGKYFRNRVPFCFFIYSFFCWSSEGNRNPVCVERGRKKS